MNPFSAFLQPPTQRSPLAGAGEFVQGLQRDQLERQKFAHLQKENALDNERSNAFLKIQQSDQSRRFSEADKKEIESALAEYQDAEDQGDPVRLSRAAQMLKRFGMDVSQGGMDPRAAAFTGAQALPGMLPMVPGKGNAFTGTAPDEANPIGDAIATERATRDKLRARTEAPLLSQEDFEADLIANPGSIPESPDEPEVIDLDAEDPTPLQLGGLPKVSAGTKDFPVPEGTVDGGDLDAVEQASQAPQVASQMAPALPGGLPVRISKGGRQLYESTGPSGRWAPMVQGVFQAAAQHQDPEFAAAGKRAQEMATKLIGVDGIAPKDAIKFAASQLENEIQNITNFRRTELGTRPKWGGGGGTGLLGKTQDIAESVQVYDDNARAEAAKIQEEDRQYEAIEAAISSGNPALQRDAVNVLLKIRSGSAVTASEDARISQINGLIAQVQDRFGRWTGGAMTPEMANTIRQIAALKRQVSAAKIKRIYEHQARLYEAQNRGKTKDPKVLEERARTLRAGGVTADSADAKADALLED